jgi:predicted O-methyltransferase YrrM
MTQEQWTAVDRYFEQDVFGEDEVFRDIRAACVAAGLPPISVSAAQGRFLSVVARAIGARRILEIGTLGGYSGSWLARALPADGRLTTLEISADYAAVARRNFERAGVAPLVDLRLGRALDLLPEIEQGKSGPFDFVFIDADKNQYPAYLEWAIRLSRPGALVVADNVVRQGRVIERKSEDAAVQGVRKFMAALGKDLRLVPSAIQTVGDKGYDGFAAAVVVATR